MVAYHYPPEGSSSGVLRTLKFSRYLPAFGWTPHVLTLPESVYPVRDDGLLTQVPPEVTVHRARGWDISRRFTIRGQRLEWMAVPDRFISWLPFGVRLGLKVVRQHAISALFSTSPQPTAHLIAGVLNLRTRLPWVADFRDPWIEEGVHPRPGTLRYRLESRLERFVVERADRVVVTTPEFRRLLVRRYADLPAHKFSAIFNGFDEEDFRNLEGAAPTSTFEIVHAGGISTEFRDPTPVLRAVSALIAERAVPRHEIRVVFFGSDYVQGAAFRQLVDQLDLRDVVHVQPRIPHHDLLRRLRQATVLLLLQASDDTRALIPAKAFEYLRVGRPILALTLEGATADLIRSTRSGIVTHPDDIAGIRRALLEFRSGRWSANGNHALIGRYERKALTGELARLLDDLTVGTTR
jgi:glycosyltransferase involved in cell wall biosynthesis